MVLKYVTILYKSEEDVFFKKAYQVSFVIQVSTNLDFVKSNIHVKIVRVATERTARKYIIPILMQENTNIKEENELKKS